MTKNELKAPNILSRQEQKKLLAVFNERYPTGLRNKTMVRLMLKSGLKLSETINLSWDNINFPAAKLSLDLDKKGRQLWLGEKTISQIEKWRKKQKELFIKKDIISKPKLVFTTLTGNQLNKDNVRKMIYRYSEKAGIQEEVLRNYKDKDGNFIEKTYKEKKVNPHTLRHTFAVELYKLTDDLKAVQKALGHSSLQSTKIYAKFKNKKEKKKMKILDDIY